MLDFFSAQRENFNQYGEVSCALYLERCDVESKRDPFFWDNWKIKRDELYKKQREKEKESKK